GDIVAQRQVAITADDDAKTVFDKCVDAAKVLLNEQLPLIKKGVAARIPQDHQQSSYYGKRCPGDGLIDWSQSATAIRHLVRGVTAPYPGAFSYRANRQFVVWKASVVPNTEKRAPGVIISSNPLTVACGEDALQIEFGQVENGIYQSGTR